ncbi:MAG: phenylacetic acid degradation protein [Rhodospirillaceae bacterium]|nr:phenylacetic acid degradation protein [Rhodospirillaceae bacterium]|tara:strand:- start:1677 stop:2099 length:423 start_codon:yes stop_codon:yes gene_type:complete
MAENVKTADELQTRLVANHFNEWMGLKIVGLDEEKIEISMTWREEMISNPKARVTHGGILGALVDVAADFMIAAKAGAPAPTVDMRVDYHRAAMPGDLKAVGRIVRLGGTFSTAEAEVFDGDGKMVASGRGLYFTGALKK